jgi:hypothetical protein
MVKHVNSVISQAVTYGALAVDGLKIAYREAGPLEPQAGPSAWLSRFVASVS